MIECIDILDELWVLKGAGYMDFGEILKSIQNALESALLSNPISLNELVDKFRFLALIEAKIGAAEQDLIDENGQAIYTREKSESSAFFFIKT